MSVLMSQEKTNISLSCYYCDVSTHSDTSSKPSFFRSTYCCPYTHLRDFVAVAKLPCLVYSGFVAALEFEGAVTGVCADTFENHVCQHDELPGLEAFQEGRL